MKRALVAAIGVLLVLSSAVPALGKQIEVWTTSLSNSEMQSYQNTLLPRFKKETGITVNLQNFGRNELDALQQQIAGGKGPDVLIGTTVESQYLVSLNQLYNSWSGRKAMVDKMIPRDTASGNIFSLPLGVSINGIAYFKTYFRNAGLNSDMPPASWEELAQATQKLTVLSGMNRRAGFESSWNGMVLDDFMVQNGGRFLSEDGRKSLLNSAAAQQALDFMKRLFQTSRDYTSPVWSTYNHRFPTEAAMSWGTASLSSAVAGIPNSNTIIGAFAAKRCASCQSAPLASPTRPISIPRTRKDLQSAWTFVTWLLSPEISVTINAPGYTLPPRTDASTQVAKIAPLLVDWYKLLPNARQFSYTVAGSYIGPGSSALQQVLYTRGSDNLLRQVLLGELDGNMVLAQLHGDYQAALDAYWAQQASR